ncbi:MAG: CDP-alcohol phosphatidyltransferase family protein [Terriglobales bacterium]
MNTVATAKPALQEWCYPANVLTELRLVAAPLIVVAVGYRRWGWAFAAFAAAALSDGFDGWLARRLRQQSALGRYLDPLADKALLSALFVALSVLGALPWPVTILVFTRDGCILTTGAVLHFTTEFRDFRPSWWGKASTTAELATVGVTMLEVLWPSPVMLAIEEFGWYAVSFLVVFSGIHYAFASARRYHRQRLQAR